MKIDIFIFNLKNKKIGIMINKLDELSPIKNEIVSSHKCMQRKKVKYNI
jgi:hypothetical protein